MLELLAVLLTFVVVLAIPLVIARRFGSAEVLIGCLIACGVACGGLFLFSRLPAASVMGLGYAAAGLAGLLVLLQMRASEKKLAAELFPREEPDGRVGDHLVAGRQVSVRLSFPQRRQGEPGRFLDDRTVLLSVRIATDDLNVRRPALFDPNWPGPIDTVARRYWLDQAVLEAIVRVPNAQISDGWVELRRGRWCTRARIEAWLAELSVVAAPLLAAEERVVARIVTEPNPILQRYDWDGLCLWAPVRARALATTIPSYADPAVVAGAAELRSDVVTLEWMLRTTDHAAALERLAGWAMRANRSDLATQLAARFVFAPAPARPAILRALADIGGRSEMPLLLEVVRSHQPTALRTLAENAMVSIRARIGHERIGTVAIADVAGGAVSVTNMASEGALSRPDLARDAPSTTGRGDPSARLDLDDP